MNATIARALSLAVVVAVWAAVSHLAKLPLQLWPVIIGLACFLAAGSGTFGLSKAIVSSASGVIWVMIYVAVSRALGRQDIVDALVLGAAVFGMVYQARVPLLAFTPGAIAGAGVALGAMGTRVVNLEAGIRVVVTLAIGAGLGFGAEYAANMLRRRNA